MNDELDFPLSFRAEGEGCNCPDCSPCSDARCMELRGREHRARVAAMERGLVDVRA